MIKVEKISDQNHIRDENFVRRKFQKILELFVKVYKSPNFEKITNNFSRHFMKVYSEFDN